LEQNKVLSKTNSQGFSLIEVLITSALVSGIVLLCFTVSKNINTELQKVEIKNEIVLDQAGVLKTVNDDLLGSAPSFNFINSRTDSNQSLDFWTIWDTDNGARSLKLQAHKDCLTFLSFESTRKIDLATGLITRPRTILANPDSFYKPHIVGNPLVFEGAKVNQFLSNNSLNIPDHYLKLSVMMPIHDNLGFYQDYGIILKLKSNGEYIENTSDVPVYPAPSTCTNTSSDLDEFLRCLPSPGGGAVFIYISPVDKITYCLRTIQTSPGFALFRKRNNHEIQIGSRLKSIELKRNSSANVITNVEVLFCAKNSTTTSCL